jgi:hypothetical protein
MDKKKVIELIEQAIIWSRQANQYSVISNLEEALKELNKSDWVSVEDGLPPCEEEVLVRDINAKGNWSKPWICYRSKNECYRHITDKHKFVTTRLGEITHWRPIEKLEE